MSKKSHVKKTSRKRRGSIEKKSKIAKKGFQKRAQKKSVKKMAGKILVSKKGTESSNVLNLKNNDSAVLETTEKLRPKEFTWQDYDENCEPLIHKLSNENIGKVNFVIKENKPSFVIDLLVALPRDFIFFYKNKIKVLSRIVQRTLEEIGKLPFRVVLGFLSIMELHIVRPLFKRVYIMIRVFCYSIFWIARIGFWTIINFPRNAVLFLKPAPSVSWSRSIVAFAIVCFVIILPFGAYTHIVKLKSAEGVVLGVTTEAYEYLQAAQAATKSLNFKKANENFKKANESFILAQNEINELNFLISGVINVLPKGAAAQRVLLAGQAISEAGAYMTAGLDVLDEKRETRNEKLRDGGVLNDSSLMTDDSEMTEVDLGIGDKVKLLQGNFTNAYPKIVLARENLEKVPPNVLPEENRENFEEIKNKVLGLEAVCKKLFSFSKIVNELLAIDGSKRYLVIFQNEQEIRPTGGFIGSFALLDVKNGVIKQIEVPGGGPYDMAGSLLKRVAPPAPLQLVNSQWHMQDGNWFADFSESAKKIMWFYENSGGATTDGVIAITSGLIPELLEITGPIEMEEYDKIISKDNFYIETQMAVEVEYDKIENKPKKFIADLTPKLLEKIINIPSDKIVDLLGAVDLGLTQKKIMFYFSNESTQKEVISNNWAGEIKQIGETDDYFLAVNSNIGGGKTDGVIDQKIIHETEISNDGYLIDTVTIIRSHNGGPGYFFANQRNVNYLRIYAPEGSVLLEAKGFEPLGPGNFRELAPDLGLDEDLERIEGQGLVDEITGTRITNEFGKTVFGNWLILEPGETGVCKIKYRLPWVLDFANEQELKDNVYTLLIQKQPGAKDNEIEKIIFLPKGLEVGWKYPVDEFVGEHNEMVKFRSDLDMDKYFGIVFK